MRFGGDFGSISALAAEKLSFGAIANDRACHGSSSAATAWPSLAIAEMNCVKAGK